MLQRLSSSLRQAADDLHFSKGLRRGRLLEAWVEAVGPLLAHQVAPADIQGETLHLICTSPTWSQEILLHQKAILDRLNRLLGDPPVRRLRCRIGRFQPHPNPPSPVREERYAWDQVVLDEETSERIERLVAEIRDPALAERLKRLMIQTERRRLVAFRSGAIRCASCGMPTPQSPCRSCRREAQALRRQTLERRLAGSPWLTRSDLLEDFPDLRPEDFLEIKTRLRSRLEQAAWAGMRALPQGAPLPDSLRADLVELVMLTTGLPAHRLDTRHVRHALCPTLARAYLENRACGPWDASVSPRRKGTRPEADDRATRPETPRRR